MPSTETPGADAFDADTTAELLARARGGDEYALNELFTRTMPALKRWASGRLPSWARDIIDTDDLVQETVWRTVGRLGTFEYHEETGLVAYLRQAVMNRIKNELRRAIRRPEQAALDSQIEDEALSPLEALLGKETIAAYDGALEQLEPRDQDLIIGRVELGLSFAELALATGRPSADAARMAVGRALVRMARHLHAHTPSPAQS